MSHDAPTIDRELADSVSGTHRRALEKIFQHPLTHNLSWREVTSLFETIGIAEHRHNGELVLGMGDGQIFMKPAHGKDLAATEVMDVRRLLVRAGFAAKASEPVTRAGSAAPDVMVIIDHDGARIQVLDADSPATAAVETQHLRHQHIDRKHHDADREENYPADTRFFEAVAVAMPAIGRIFVIGHGKGQSNEASHLIAYLAQHHQDIDARISGNIVADLPHLTVPQLVKLARDGFETGPNEPVSDA